MLYFVNLLIISATAFLLLFPFIIHLFFLISKKRKLVSPASSQADIACVITSFKNVDMALLAADSLLRQNYTNFHVYLIADACDITGLDATRHPKLSILKPETTLGSKVRSMKYALDNFIRDHSAIAIFDPDNLADKNFLIECNNYLSAGFQAVQGRRTAKNLDTQIACLDAMGEVYYNYITKKIPFELGSSSVIAGSGMVINKGLFKDFFEMPYIRENYEKVIPGEDKILHYFIVSNRERIAYNEDAVLYDEKISNAGMVQNQRARWINSYLLNLKNAGKLFLRGITSFDVNLFLSGIITLYPPLFLLILTALLFTILNLLFVEFFAIILIISVAIFILNFILVLAINKVSPRIWSALWGIPFFVLNQLLALLNIKKSNKEFLTTQNDKKMSLDDVLNDKKS